MATALLDDPCADERGLPTWTIENIRLVLEKGRSDQRYEQTILIDNNRWVTDCNHVSHVILDDSLN